MPTHSSAFEIGPVGYASVCESVCGGILVGHCNLFEG